MYLVYTGWWIATTTDLFTNKTGEKTTFTTGTLLIIYKHIYVFIIFLVFQFCKQYLVCGDSCGSPVWLAQELNRERQQQEVKKDLYVDQIFKDNLICRWIPDLKSGWEYRPLVRTMDHLDSNSWHSDDGSLRIEYLRGSNTL